MVRPVTHRAALLCVATALASGLFAPGEACAQAARKTEPRVTAVPAQPSAVMPDADKIVLLLRSTLLTLNDAVQTGNYTVLRDRGAPGFRDANTAARLAQIFAPLAAQGADLTPAGILAPQLTDVPTIEPQRQMLRLKGVFPSQPRQIAFEVLYEPVAGTWRLFGISVAMTQAAPQTSAAEPPGIPLQTAVGLGLGVPKAKASPWTPD
jgi:hypothetical protein